MNTNQSQKLNVFIGNWHAEGTSYGEGQDINNPTANGVAWVSDESYECLPGNFFVLHKWNAKTGDHPFIGTEIIGYDEAKQEFFAYIFDNGGNHPVYTATVNGNEWSFTEPNTRANMNVNDDETITIHWEWKPDGSNWLPLCDRVAKRMKR